MINDGKRLTDAALRMYPQEKTVCSVIHFQVQFKTDLELDPFLLLLAVETKLMLTSLWKASAEGILSASFKRTLPLKVVRGVGTFPP